MTSPDVPPDDSGRDGRDPKGRFVKDNKCAVGFGNPLLRRRAELQRAVSEALTVDDLRGVLLAMHALAIAGDVPAAGLLLGYAIGKPREQEPPVDGIVLPDLTTAAGIASAVAQLTHAAAAGDMPIEVAERIAALVSRAADAGVLVDLAAKIRKLEDARESQ